MKEFSVQFTELDNNKNYFAIICDRLNPLFIEDGKEQYTYRVVVSSNRTTLSSYGLKHWIDGNGDSFGQIQFPLVGYIPVFIAEITEEEVQSFLDEPESAIFNINNDKIVYYDSGLMPPDIFDIFFERTIRSDVDNDTNCIKM